MQQKETVAEQAPYERIPTDTYELARAFTDVCNALTRFQVIACSKNMGGDARTWIFQQTKILKSILLDLHDPTRIKDRKKYWLKANAKKLDIILTNVKMLFIDKPVELEMVKSDIFADDRTLQYDAIMSMLMELPSGTVDQVCDYIEGVYNVYKMNN